MVWIPPSICSPSGKTEMKNKEDGREEAGKEWKGEKEPSGNARKRECSSSRRGEPFLTAFGAVPCPFCPILFYSHPCRRSTSIPALSARSPVPFASSLFSSLPAKFGKFGSNNFCPWPNQNCVSRSVNKAMVWWAFGRHLA